MAKKEKIDELVPVEEQPYPVPENWRWVRLGSLGYTNIGLTYKPVNISETGTIVLRSCNIANGHLVFDDIVKVDMDIPQSKMSQKGDILICARNGSKALVGKTAIIDKDGMSYGAFMAIFRSQYNPYIYYFLNSIYFRRIIDNDVGTTTINQVTQELIKSLAFPLAPLAEQQRIVGRIKSLFAKLDEAKEKAQAVVEGFENQKAAILHKAFTGELTEKWREENSGCFRESVTIRSVCSSLAYGTATKSSQEGEVAVIRMGNLQGGEINWNNLVYSNNEDDNQKYKLVEGDVLFNRTNSAEQVGKTSIYRGERPAIYAGYLIKLDYDRSRINGEYLNYLLNSPEAKEYCNRVKSDAVNQSNINAQKIGVFEIPLISMEEQKEIVNLLNSMLRNEKQSRESAESIIVQIDDMKKSILAKAFRGELGTNDPTESPVEIA